MSTFIEYKQTLEAQLQEKKRLLEEGAKEHDTHVSDLERKHVQEKDRLKKEMLLKLRETKANLLKMTDNQLDTTTKRTIAENEQMSAELAWQVHTGRPPSAHRPPHAPCAHPACTLRAPCAHPARTLRAPCAHPARTPLLARTRPAPRPTSVACWRVPSPKRRRSSFGRTTSWWRTTTASSARSRCTSRPRRSLPARRARERRQ